MKMTIFSTVAFLGISICQAQQVIPKNTVMPLAYGSLQSSRIDAKLGKEIISNKILALNSNEGKYNYKISKTSDGSTTTFVKFKTQDSYELPKNKFNDRFNKEIGKVTVYPNPANGDITIKYFIPQNENAEFSIYDLAGKKITSYLLNGENNQLTISLANLNPGIYLYNVVSNGKIVKQDKIVVIR